MSKSATATNAGSTAPWATIKQPAQKVAVAVLIVGILLGLWQYRETLLTLMAITPQSVAFGTVALAIFTVIVWLLYRRSSLAQPTKRADWWLLFAFTWGAMGTMVFVDWLQDAVRGIAVGFGWEGAEMALAGAYPEELGKAVGVALILIAGAKYFNRVWDGFIVGIATGLGFELFETMTYGATGGLTDPNSDIGGALSTLGLRFVLGFGLHAFWTGIIGYALGRALLDPRLSTAQRWLLAVGACFASFIFHFGWNYQAESVIINIGKMAVIYIGMIAITVWLWRRCAKVAKAQAAAANPAPRVV